jgi:Excalibur calcium-binding domain
MRSWLRVIAGVMLLTSGVPTSSRAQGICGTKTHCRDMATCAEAYYFLTVCGLRRLDADSDGIPCETICGKTLEQMQARIAAEPFARSLAKSIAPAPVGSNSGNGGLVPTSGRAESSYQPAFSCGNKRTCKEMTSCDEAKFYLNKCGLKRLDGDGDGIPCNGLCR